MSATGEVDGVRVEVDGATARVDGDRAAFCHWLLGRVDEVTNCILARLLDTFPAAADREEGFVESMTRRTRDLLVASLERLAQGDSVESLGPLVEGAARQRRLQGISLSIQLAAYHVLQVELLAEIRRQAAGHPREEEWSQLAAGLMLEAQWMASRRLVDAYDGDPFGSGQDDDMHAVLEMLLGRLDAPDDLRERIERLGVVPPLRRLTVSVVLPEGADPLEVARDVGAGNPWAVWGRVDGRVVVLGREQSRRVPGPCGVHDFGEEGTSDPRIIGPMFRRCAAAADAAARLGRTQLSTTAATPWVAVLSLPGTEREAFLRYCFGDLHLTPRGRPLLEAVAALLSEGNRAEASRRLHIHPHTLDYRLGRFREYTGVDLSDGVRRLDCTVGLMMLGLFAADRTRTEPVLSAPPATLSTDAGTAPGA